MLMLWITLNKVILIINLIPLDVLVFLTFMDLFNISSYSKYYIKNCYGASVTHSEDDFKTKIKNLDFRKVSNFSNFIFSRFKKYYGGTVEFFFDNFYNKLIKTI